MADLELVPDPAVAHPTLLNASWDQVLLALGHAKVGDRVIIKWKYTGCPDDPPMVWNGVLQTTVADCPTEPKGALIRFPQGTPYLALASECAATTKIPTPSALRKQVICTYCEVILGEESIEQPNPRRRQRDDDGDAGVAALTSVSLAEQLVDF